MFPSQLGGPWHWAEWGDIIEMGPDGHLAISDLLPPGEMSSEARPAGRLFYPNG